MKDHHHHHHHLTHGHSWTAVVLKSMTNNLPHPLQCLVTPDCRTNGAHYLRHQSGVWETRGLSRYLVGGGEEVTEFRELEGWLGGTSNASHYAYCDKKL